MRVEILKWLNEKYETINKEYVEACAIDFMSRRATYLDGQLAILNTLINEVYAHEDEVEEEAEVPDYDPEDFDFEDDVDETNYDPYMGCDNFDY